MQYPDPRQNELFPAPKFTPEERKVLEILDRHRGKDKAIRVPDLAEQIDMDGRTVRKVVKHLVEFHHISIGSTPSGVAGYYMIRTADEAWEVFLSLRRRALSILRRATAFQKATLPELLGQLSLEVEKNPKLDLGEE